ncbi:membrane-associated phospholipid phosphatase [Hamadaea flava]|uniref:Phosphatase PAP2 family protein n=1 Tax=Hamadaea flava TaxID=1742688 RepID=A0ABV8M1D3_9ACTN|nr:phosphatase PAP2 family protein [Hamadaea flava]MCP2323503.1 membrane-associated phospholipid phosphatase [Hamadaea flava]
MAFAGGRSADPVTVLPCAPSPAQLADRPRHTAAVVAVLAGIAFSALMTAVWLGWPPLIILDQRVAEWLTSGVSSHPGQLTTLRVITTLGSTTMLASVMTITAIVIVARRWWRAAAFLAVAELAPLLVGPVLKLLMDRARPVVAHVLVAPPATLSFPSGHALGSTVSYGAILWLCLPLLPQRRLEVAASTVAALVALVGFSRVALGVHYVSDVAGGWLPGLAWLAMSALLVTRRR